jgi:uncharacterized protein Usg
MAAYVHSHSGLELFELCPRKFEGQYITRSYPYKEDEKAMWGKDCHKALEKNTLYGQPLGERFKDQQWIVDKFSKLPGTKQAETRFGIRKDLSPCDFFDKDVYYRGQGDYIANNGRKVFCADYKSGKKKTGGLDLERMALLIFSHFPDCEEVLTAFIWLQTKDFTPATYTRAQVPEIWERLLESATTVEWAQTNNRFPARENFLCRSYCPVVECVFNGRRGS